MGVEGVVLAVTKTVAGMTVAPQGSTQRGEAWMGRLRMAGRREERDMVIQTVVGLVAAVGLVELVGLVEVGEAEEAEEEGEDVVEGGEALGGGSLMRMGVMRRDQVVGLVVGVAVEGEGSVAAVKMVMEMMNLERKNQVRTIARLPVSMDIEMCFLC